MLFVFLLVSLSGLVAAEQSESQAPPRLDFAGGLVGYIADGFKWGTGKAERVLVPGLEQFKKESEALAEASEKLGASDWAKVNARDAEAFGRWGKGLKWVGVGAAGISNYLSARAKGWDRKDSGIEGSSQMLATYASGGDPSWGAAIQLANAGANMVGAPKPVTGGLEIASEVVPSNQAAKFISFTTRAGLRLAQGDGKGFDQVMQGAVDGNSGGPLQGYTAMTSMLADKASGYSWEQSLMRATSKKGAQSTVAKLGTYLGDQTYKFVNHDLPDLKYYASRDYQNAKRGLREKWDGFKHAAKNTIVTPVAKAYDSVAQTATKAVDATTDGVKFVYNKAADLGSSAVSSVTDGAKSAWQKLKSWW